MIRLRRPPIIQADGRARIAIIHPRTPFPFEVQSDSVFEATQGSARALPLPLSRQPSACVGGPAFRRNPVCVEKPIRDRSSFLRGFLYSWPRCTARNVLPTPFNGRRTICRSSVALQLMPVKRESGELRQDRRGEADFLLGAHVAPIAHLSATDFDRPHHGHGPHRAIQTDNLSGQQILLFRSPR